MIYNAITINIWLLLSEHLNLNPNQSPPTTEQNTPQEYAFNEISLPVDLSLTYTLWSREIKIKLHENLDSPITGKQEVL